MTDSDKTLLDELFQRYGSSSQEAVFQITGCFTKADNISKTAYIQTEDKEAAHMIEELLHKIDQLNAYRLSLAERYNVLETAPTIPVVRLSRERNFYSEGKKVYYYLYTLRRFIDSGAEVEESRRKYPGTERNAAIKDFRAYVKSHPGIIAEMDIEKSRWEK